MCSNVIAAIKKLDKSHERLKNNKGEIDANIKMIKNAGSPEVTSALVW